MATTRKMVVKKAAAKKVASKKVATKKAATKKAATKKAVSKKAALKRTLVEPTPGDKRYVRRDAEGRFDDVVDEGKSLSVDKRTAARKVVKPGQGDQGDLKKKTTANGKS